MSTYITIQEHTFIRGHLLYGPGSLCRSINVTVHVWISAKALSFFFAATYEIQSQKWQLIGSA